MKHAERGRRYLHFHTKSTLYYKCSLVFLGRFPEDPRCGFSKDDQRDQSGFHGENERSETPKEVSLSFDRILLFSTLLYDNFSSCFSHLASVSHSLKFIYFMFFLHSSLLQYVIGDIL